MLQTRGILYAPDYMINSGGAIGLVGLEQLGWRQPELDAGLARIGGTLRCLPARSGARHLNVRRGRGLGRGADQRLGQGIAEPQRLNAHLLRRFAGIVLRS